MKTNPMFLLRDVAGVHLLLSLAGEKDAPAAMKLNDTGALLFHRLEGGATEDELVSALLDEYDVSRELAQRDVTLFLDSLRKVGALEE